MSPWLGLAMCCLALSFTFLVEHVTTEPTDRVSKWSAGEPGNEQNHLSFHLYDMEHGRVLRRVKSGNSEEAGVGVKRGCSTSAWFCSHFLLLPFFYPLISKVLYYSCVPRVLRE